MATLTNEEHDKIVQAYVLVVGVLFGLRKRRPRLPQLDYLESQLILARANLEEAVRVAGEEMKTA